VSAIRAGYATAGTDTGHVGGNADFVAGHPEKLVDFAYRAIHEMTVSAKAMAVAHYDARPARAYFSSCSTGGRQALVEAQRYPEDFDGIVAGDASWDQMRLYAARVALNVFMNREPRRSFLRASTRCSTMPCWCLRRLGRREGRRDRRPVTVHVRLRGAGMCRRRSPRLSDQGTGGVGQSHSVAIVDRQSGAVLHPGRYYPGSELGWGSVGGPAPSGESLEGMKKIVFTPGWDPHTIRVPDDVERAVRADRGCCSAEIRTSRPSSVGAASS